MSSDKYDVEESIEFEQQYLIGLIDYLASPRLRPIPGKTGYGLQTSVKFSFRQSELLQHILSQLFDNLDVEYRISTTSDGKPKEATIGDFLSIKKLCDFGAGSYIQNGKKFKYLVQVNDRYRGKNISGRPDVFLQIFKPWADMHPEWKNHKSRKYTLDFFKTKFGIENVSEEDDVPAVSYPNTITDQYVAGFFDAKGRLKLQAAKSRDYTLGYTLSPGLRIALSNPQMLVGPHLKKYLADTSITPVFKESNSKLLVYINSNEDIEAFLEQIGKHCYYNYDICQLFYEQLIPAYRDGYHRSKSGFLDMLRAYENVKNYNRESKYDVEYFESIWEL